MKNQYTLFQKVVEATLKTSLVPEYQFCKDRKFRFDFAIIEKKIAIEIEGGIYTNGRHTRGKGFSNDMQKYNLAIELGWRVLRYSPDQTNKNETIDQIKKVFNNPTFF